MNRRLPLLIFLIATFALVTPAHALMHRRKPVPAPTSAPVKPTPAPVQNPVSTDTIQWGAFTGGSLASLKSFSQIVGVQPEVVAVFIGDNEPFTDYASFAGASQTLVVYWESDLTAAQIAKGAADVFVKKWAAQIKSYDRPVILSVLDEMNGDWSAYNGDPADYKTAFIRVHNLFAGVSNVKFAYVVNNDSEPDTTANGLMSYYPGDAYVDIVGVDGFNGYLAWGGPSLTWSQVFLTDPDKAIPTLRAAYPSKPLWIMSTASCQGSSEPQFIDDMATDLPRYDVQGFVWFDVSKECNWTVNSSQATLAAFKGLIQ